MSRDIIAFPVAGGIVLQRPDHVIDHVFVSFQETAHNVLEAVVLPHDLDIFQERIAVHDLPGYDIRVHHKSVNVVLQHIESQALKRCLHGNPGLERHFQDNFDLLRMARPDHVFQLGCSILSCRIGFFWREIESSAVSPVIDMSAVALLKFIDRHALDLVDAELLQIRDLLYDALKSPLVRSFR